MLAGFRWIENNRLAGSGLPGLLGTLDEDLAMLRREGFGLVVTLTREPGISIEGIEQLHFPIDDMGIPTPRACEDVCRRIVARMEAGDAVLVHCRAGLGRTGLVAACVLVTAGDSASAALRKVRGVHGGYVQTPAQERFVSHYEQHLRAERQEPAGPVDLRPDPAYYEAIGGDEAVLRIVRRFYDAVFVDPILAPHFKQTDKETIAGKQFGFMRRCLTGDRNAYMGQRPRNAHHWMVISDAEFDHRERLMRDALVAEGLSDKQVERWIAVEEVFRRQIVKSEPWPLYYRGLETFWTKSPSRECISIDTLCDRCGGELPANTPLWIVHDTILCAGCAGIEMEVG